MENHELLGKHNRPIARKARKALAIGAVAGAVLTVGAHLAMVAFGGEDPLGLYAFAIWMLTLAPAALL